MHTHRLFALFGPIFSLFNLENCSVIVKVDFHPVSIFELTARADFCTVLLVLNFVIAGDLSEFLDVRGIAQDRPYSGTFFPLASLYDQLLEVV